MDNNPRLPFCPFWTKDAPGKLYCEGAVIKCPDFKAKRDLLDTYCTDPKNHLDVGIITLIAPDAERGWEVGRNESVHCDYG